MTDKLADVGLTGLGTMGQSLALNLERNGYCVAVHNRTTRVTDAFVAGEAKGKRFIPLQDLAEMPRHLERPRKLILMIPAGSIVDTLMETLIPHLDPGDILIDAGNSLYQDTNRRTHYLESKGLLFIGTGVSGGEEGALWGPSIMPGGSPKAWPFVKEMLQKIAAKTDDGTPCCDWIGKEGAGHFVKMVHNGIEYADMQLIAEAYYLMKMAAGMDNAQMAQAFEQWNRGELDSYLIEATADILTRKDPDTGRHVVDLILDAAGQKGTGKWTVEASLDLGAPAPTIADAVFARVVSSLKQERVHADQDYRIARGKMAKDQTASFAQALERALYSSKICAYAQGFALMRQASSDYGWDLDFGRIALLWRQGCIIRARFLDRIKAAFDRDAQLPNLLLDPFFKGEVMRGLDDWRKVVVTAGQCGHAVPAFMSALAYFDAYTQASGSANLLQALRDYFGAHTYQRLDKEGTFHSEWKSLPC